MLVYGSEAVLPVKLAIRTHRTTTFQIAQNNQALREALDLLPLVRGDANLREEITKARMARFYNPNSFGLAEDGGNRKRL